METLFHKSDGRPPANPIISNQLQGATLRICLQKTPFERENP